MTEKLFNGLQIGWVPAKGNGGSPLTNYRIEYKIDSKTMTPINAGLGIPTITIFVPDLLSARVEVKVFAVN